MNEKIWGCLVNMQFKSFVIDLQTEQFQRFERNINIYLAIASSTSIAAWAIWKDLEMLWAIIIAVSQIMTVIKPYFPYYKYVKELSLKSLRLASLNLEYEKLWDKIQASKITEDEASELYYEYKKESIEILKFADDTIFKVSSEIEKKAEAKMNIFLKSNYNINQS